jgi:hypothetical protein
MSAVRSGFLCLVIALGLLGCAALLFPDLAAGVGLDLRDLADLLRKMQEVSVRSDQLQVEQEETLGRVTAKREAVAAVIAGRLTLREAAHRFHDLDEACPNFNRAEFRRSHLGATDEERYRRAVVEYVRQELQARPEQGQEVLRRLEVELCDDAPPSTRTLRGQSAEGLTCQ